MDYDFLNTIQFLKGDKNKLLGKKSCILVYLF